MEEEIVREISETEYQELKKILNKKDNYFNKEELNILMQFLMQRQEKVIRNEEKI